MQQKKKILPLPTGLALAFTLLFLLSGAMLIRDLDRAAGEQAANEKLLWQVEQKTSRDRELSATNNGNLAIAPNPEQDRNYQPLVQENDCLAAWLIIDGIDVDYPVLYTPEDPDCYLHKAFDGSYALSGSLFIAENCLPDGNHIIIYGHNMKDGSMFGRLESYADEDYAREHREIVYDLIQADGSYERLIFEVMAAFYSRVYKIDEKNVFRYYYGTDLSNSEDFQYYVQEAMAASLYDLGVTATYGERLLTLSTCSYYTDDGRFVVVAREKRSL